MPNNQSNSANGDNVNPVPPEPFLFSNNPYKTQTPSSTSKVPCDSNSKLTMPIIEFNIVKEEEAQADRTTITPSSSSSCQKSPSQHPTKSLYHRSSSLPEDLPALIRDKRTSAELQMDLPQRLNKKQKTSPSLCRSFLQHGVSSLPCLRTSIMETSTDDLLAELEAELFRRIVDDDQDRVQHQQQQRGQASNRRLWNPSENSRIAQDFRAYGVPDTTDFTHRILQEVSESESSNRSLEDLLWSSPQQEPKRPLHHSILHPQRSPSTTILDLNDNSPQPGRGCSLTSMRSVDCFDDNTSALQCVNEEELGEELGLNFSETIMSPIFRDATLSSVDILQPLHDDDMDELF